MKYGVDISHWQSNVTLSSVANTTDFLFHKATESTNYVDPTFTARWSVLGQLGFPRGAYHFAHPGSSVGPQVDHFLRTVEPHWLDGDVAILDMEGTATAFMADPREGLASPRQDVPFEEGKTPFAIGGVALTAWADAWLDRVRAALSSEVIFYTYIPFILNTMGDPASMPGNATGWIARYTTGGVYSSPLRKPRAFPTPPEIWQCSNGVNGCVTSVPGVGAVDYNRMQDTTFTHLFLGEDMGLTYEETVQATKDAIHQAARDYSHPFAVGLQSAADTEEKTDLLLTKVETLLATPSGNVDVNALADMIIGALGTDLAIAVVDEVKNRL